MYIYAYQSLSSIYNNQTSTNYLKFNVEKYAEDTAGRQATVDPAVSSPKIYETPRLELPCIVSVHFSLTSVKQNNDLPSQNSKYCQVLILRVQTA